MPFDSSFFGDDPDRDTPDDLFSAPGVEGRFAVGILVGVLLALPLWAAVIFGVRLVVRCVGGMM
jgi:hypothetical protein